MENIAFGLIVAITLGSAFMVVHGKQLLYSAIALLFAFFGVFIVCIVAVIEVVFRNRQSIRFRAIDEKNDRFLFRNRCLVFLGSSEHVIVRGGVDVRVFRVRGVLLFSSVVFKIVEHLGGISVVDFVR